VLDERSVAIVGEFRTLARSLAWKYFQKSPGAADLDELTGIAMLGLTEAAERYPRYCEAHGYDVRCADYLPAYLGRRITGALLDASRAADHLTRSDRNIQKALAEFEDLGLDRAAQAKAAGIDARKADEVRAAQASKAISLEQPGAEDDGHVVTDDTDVESQAVAGSILGAALDTMTKVLDGRSCLAVALRFYWGLDMPAIAAVLGTGEGLVTGMLETAVTELHSAMLRAAS
jgi:DNA-directed RNA polymerase specialized sigma subunit